MKKYHYLQLSFFFTYIFLTTIILITQGVGITPDRYFIVLVVGAFLINHSKNFIHDFAPFLFLLISYDFLRGFADDLNKMVDFQSPITITNALFGGRIPTVELQHMFYTPGLLHWFDYLAGVLYSLHFAIPFTFAFFLWFQNRERFREFMLGLVLLSYGGLIMFFLHPIAPPWLASEHGNIPHVVRILHLVQDRFPETINLPTIYHRIGPNPVAAIPSLHAGYTLLVLLYAVKFLKYKGWIMLVYIAAMWLSIIYLGEHYVIDVLAGAISAFFAFKFSGYIMNKYAKELEIL